MQRLCETDNLLRMLLSPHAVTGATIAAFVPNPALSFPAAIASHFLLDTVPHWQETLPPYTPHAGTWIRVPVDVGLAVGLVSQIARSHPERARSIWMAACAAMVPDIDSVLSVLPGLAPSETLRRYTRWHVRLQNETGSLWGLVPQVGLILACLLVAESPHPPTPLSQPGRGGALTEACQP